MCDMQDSLEPVDPVEASILVGTDNLAQKTLIGDGLGGGYWGNSYDHRV